MDQGLDQHFGGKNLSKHWETTVPHANNLVET